MVVDDATVVGLSMVTVVDAVGLSLLQEAASMAKAATAADTREAWEIIVFS